MKWLTMLMMLIGLLAWGNLRADDKKCAECHEVEVESHAKSLHGKTWALKGDTTLSCSTCHGDGARHNAQKDPTADTIISFNKGTKTAADVQNNQCLTCHKTSKETSAWKLSKHANNGVTCVSCHSNHKGITQTKPTTETCFSCHKEQKLQSKAYSHHPIVEGKVSCNDCHNPHGTVNDNNLRADSVNALCYKCHTDKRGPFMWEHPPVEENCLNCHVSHGSNHLRLLKKTAPNLCQECHMEGSHPTTLRDGSSGMNGTAASQTVTRSCQNCHTKIHGSHGPTDPAGGRAMGKYFTR